MGYSQFLMPGLVDTHIHAPQYSFTGTGYDLQLLDWLDTYTYPTESKFENVQLAKKVYSKVVVSLRFQSSLPWDHLCLSAAPHSESWYHHCQLLCHHSPGVEHRALPRGWSVRVPTARKPLQLAVLVQCLRVSFLLCRGVRPEGIGREGEHGSRVT